MPRLAVSGSLALASVGMLIYFIHHLAHSIQIDTIMSQVEREIRSVIDDVDPDPLVAAAVRHELVIGLAKQVGDHVVAGTPLAWAWRRSPGPWPTPSRSGSSGPWCRTSASASAGWSTSAARRCRRPSTTLHRRPGGPAPVGAAVRPGPSAPGRLDGARRPGRAQGGRAPPQVPRRPAAGTAQIRRFGAAEPAVTRALIVLLRDAGTSSATEDRRHACVHHLRLVLADARRATAQPADVEAIAAEAATALRLLGVDPA